MHQIVAVINQVSVAFEAWLWQITIWFGSERYQPWAYSLTYDTLLTTLYVVTNVIMGTCAAIIGVVLAIHHRYGICFHGQQRLLLGWCFFLYGLHFSLSTVTLFIAVYRLDIVAKAAATSVTLIFMLTTTRFILNYGK